jgi:Lrp/AsnC family transcriptional regulator for asnA, asnC and gidA
MLAIHAVFGGQSLENRRNPLLCRPKSTDSLAFAFEIRNGRPVSRRVSVDEVSATIIGLLQRDGRMSYAAIGKEVGLSEAAVRQRVQRLQDSGLVQIVAVTDPLRLGFGRAAMVGITVAGDLETIGDKLEGLPEVTYLVTCAGSFDFLAEIVVEDDDHLVDVVSRGIRSIPGVQRAEVFVYLNMRKQIYSWGAR